jgi:Raf kinase inhibitor-like YbhB/YbcL family protein
MRKSLAILLFAALLVSGCTAGGPQETIDMATLKLSSPAFSDKGTIPVDYSCQGLDMSPPLNIAGIPLHARSLALVMDDPDATMGTWVHWVVFNISSRTESIPEGSPPAEALVGRNSWGNNSYGGPCPPSGTHRYLFKLYALDTMLDLKSSATRSDVEKAMEGHVLAQTTLVGLYKRKP